jgi:hypothetical protein
MKATLLTFATIYVLVLSGCTTPVAIDPQTGQDQLAEYRAGYFYAPLDAPIGQIFNAAIRELDNLGYFRTGELHKDGSITIYARKVGDEKVTVRAKRIPEGPAELRIRIGNLGNLAESQVLYAHIRDAL